MVRHGKHSHAKPNQTAEEGKEVWVNMVKGIIKTVGDSNEDLTFGLEKICVSKKVPRSWMNLNKPKFVVSNMIAKIKKNILFMLWFLISRVS